MGTVNRNSKRILHTYIHKSTLFLFLVCVACPLGGLADGLLAVCSAWSSVFGAANMELTNMSVHYADRWSGGVLVVVVVFVLVVVVVNVSSRLTPSFVSALINANLSQFT